MGFKRRRNAGMIVYDEIWRNTKMMYKMPRFTALGIAIIFFILAVMTSLMQMTATAEQIISLQVLNFVFMFVALLTTFVAMMAITYDSVFTMVFRRTKGAYRNSRVLLMIGGTILMAITGSMMFWYFFENFPTILALIG